MLEKEIEGVLRRRVVELGGLCWKFVSPGTRGVPDRIIVMPGGRVVFAELKSAEGQPSVLQMFRLTQLQALGVDAKLVVGIDGVDALLGELAKGVMYG